MKKVTLLLLLLCSFSFVRGQETLSIGILDEKRTTESELQLQQLKQEISTLLRQETKVLFKEVLYNDHDISKAKTNYNQLLNETTDIIIAFGVVNTIMLYLEKSYPTPLINVGAINNDLVKIPEGQETSKINNLTYLATPFSYKEDLDVFETLHQFNKVGVVVDDFLLERLPLDSLFDSYFDSREATYEFIQISDGDQIGAISEEIDAIYIASSNKLSSDGLDNLIMNINQRKIPSLSNYGVSDVEKGILATNQPAINFDRILRRIALNVEAINDQINPSDLPLLIEYNKKLTLNMSTADLIDFPIKNSMLARINLIDGESALAYKDQLSLKEILEGVIQRNLPLDAGRKNILLSEQDVKTSKSQYYPDINANVNGAYLDPKVASTSFGQNPEYSTSGNLSLNQVLYSEQATANINIQKNLLKAQTENFNTIELDILLEASVAYFNALILKTNLSLQNKNLQLTKENLAIAQENFDLGATGKSDVLRFQSQLAQNTQSMINARNSLNQAYFLINQLLNNPIDAVIEIQDSIVDNWSMDSEEYEYLLSALDDIQERSRLIDFFIQEAKQNSPEIKSISYNKEAVRRNYRLNDKGRFVPTLALQAQYNYIFNRAGSGSEAPAGFPAVPDNNYNIGISLSLPIFQQSTRNINRQSAKIQELQLEIQNENTELFLEKNVNDIVLNIINEIANIEISAVNLNFSKESLEMAQNEYKNGAIPVIQLIDAQSNYLQANLTNATARYNYLLVSAQLQRAIAYFFMVNSESSNEEFVQRATEFITKED